LNGRVVEMSGSAMPFLCCSSKKQRSDIVLPHVSILVGSIEKAQYMRKSTGTNPRGLDNNQPEKKHIADEGLRLTNAGAC
jgi:hypothetical protein